MKDYKIVKKYRGWIIKELWFTFFGYRIYKDLLVPHIVETSFTLYVDGSKLYFDNYESAILTAEFIKEHTPKKYKGFELTPIYEIDDNGVVNIDTKLYALMPDSYCKVGTYLELTSLLDDHFGDTN